MPSVRSGCRQRAVHVDEVDMLARVHLALHDRGNCRVEGTAGRLLPGVGQRDDGGDEHFGGRYGGRDVVDQRRQPAWRAGQVVVLQHVVGADVQQHSVRLVGVQPADDVGVDLVDPPAGVALVVVVAEGGRTVEL